MRSIWRGRHAAGVAEQRIKCYNLAMNTKPTLFDRVNPVLEAEADARAEADVREGRLISHEAVRRWLLSWVDGHPLTRPKVGD